MMCVQMVFFFFFQAEDGIRDIGVTGVQTCALPICWLARRRDCATAVRERTGLRLYAQQQTGRPAVTIVTTSRSRSEERREGKSVDLGGRRIIKKKKYIK